MWVFFWMVSIMENTDNGRQIVIVDDHALRRAGLESVLSSWAEKEGLKIRTFDSCEKAVLAESIGFEMCLLNIGGMSLSDAKAWQIFCALKRKCSEQPLIVLLDEETDADVRLAYLGGARGLIHTSMRTQVVVAVLSFIRSGGEYFPAFGWRESAKVNVQENRRGPTVVPFITPSEITDHRPGLSIGFPEPRRGSDGACESPDPLPLAEPCSLTRTSNEHGLTRRQDDVLELLKVGRSNKEIARALNLSESTVKIHVRQLMKKMGAANRTQVALRAKQHAIS